MFGLVYWGCCEPAHPIWEKSLSKQPNLRAVSVSRWADQEYLAETFTGRKIVFSRKPATFALTDQYDFIEEQWRGEIRNTLEITTRRGVPLAFVVQESGARSQESVIEN